MNRKLKRPAQSAAMRSSRRFRDMDAAKALKILVDGNDSLWWALWISYCNLRRKYGISAFYAYETMYNEYNFSTYCGCAVLDEKIKNELQNYAPEGATTKVE